MTASVATNAIPAYLDNFSCDIREQRFSLVGTDMVVVMNLSRGYYKNDFVGDGRLYTATCGLYIVIEPSDAAERANENRPSPRIQFSNWMTSSDALQSVHVSGNREGFRITLPNGQISDVALTEKDRLLAFLHELRGIQIKYVANIFGFLRKDGSDKEVITELRFPAETCIRED